MGRKRRGLNPRDLPRCNGLDGDPVTGRIAEGTLHLCRALATYRVEWSGASPENSDTGYVGFEYVLRPRQDRACDRHLADLLERADKDLASIRAPHGHPSLRLLDAPLAPTVIRLDFQLDRRADAHGCTEYLPVETIMTSPVPLSLF